MKKIGQAFTVLILLVFLFSGFVMAAEMDFGDLGEEFVDFDGDLVADIPAEESEWINPDTIILPLRYLVWVFIVLLFNIAEFIHFHIQLWYTLPIL